jgi:hypothetical protein
MNSFEREKQHFAETEDYIIQTRISVTMRQVDLVPVPELISGSSTTIYQTGATIAQ